MAASETDEIVAYPLVRSRRLDPCGGHAGVERVGEGPEPEPAVPEPRGAHRLGGAGEGGGAGDEFDELAQRWRGELLEGVAVGQHEAADAAGVGVQQVLADRSTGVVADERDVVQVERLDEGDDLLGDAARRLLGCRADRDAMGAEWQVGGERAHASCGKRVRDAGPQRGADEDAVDEYHRRRGVVGPVWPVVDGAVWQRDRRHVLHSLRTVCP